MYFSLFFCWLLFQAPTSPDRIVDIADLTLLPAVAAHDAEFAVVNLKLLLEQEGAATVVPMMVTCGLWHDPSAVDEIIDLTDLSFQHVVAVALDEDDNILELSKAALPCPPHCEGMRRKMTIEEFLLTR